MIRRPPRSTQSRSSAASDVYKRQRMMIMGEPLVTGLVKTFQDNGYYPVNNYTRMIARMQEILVVIPELLKWLTQDLQAGGKVAVHNRSFHGCELERNGSM